MYRFTGYLGFGITVCSPLALIYVLSANTSWMRSKESTIFMLAMQSLIGALLWYASVQKRKGADIGDKAYPASIAACILFGFFAWRWYWFGA